MVAAGERLDETGGVLMPLHGKRSQLAGDNQPSVRMSSAATSSSREIQPHHAVEEFGGFGGGKAQISGAELGTLPPSAQSGQG